jgi:uncharacterized membrane protein (DUF485 family)
MAGLPTRERESAVLAWTFTFVATVPSLGYVLALSLAREALARPVVAGSLVSVGLAAGLALAALLVVLALVYTYVMNRREAG